MQHITATNTTATATTLHYTTLRYTKYITFHYSCNYHYIALHNTTLQLQLHYFRHRLQYTRLQYTIPRYSTQHYSTLHYTNYTTPQLQLQLQLHYTNYTTLQLQLKTTTPLRYNYNHTYNYNCTTPHYIQQLWWGDHCNHCSHSRKHNSNHLSVHQWIRSAIRDSQQPTSPIGLLFLKLPPPPCAVLLVSQCRVYSQKHVGQLGVRIPICQAWVRNINI